MNTVEEQFHFWVKSHRCNGKIVKADYRYISNGISKQILSTGLVMPLCRVRYALKDKEKRCRENYAQYKYFKLLFRKDI